ncbi:MAG: hypothetical protein HY094_04570 [Candidatus Melainabacteria bacterium]|nr:hypothetical protein [Candidatus Melainabacteria bacterium]
MHVTLVARDGFPRQEIQGVIKLAESKKSKIASKSLPTKYNLFTEILSPTSEKPIARQTFAEFKKCCSGLWAIAYQAFKNPSGARKALYLLLGGEHNLQEWLVKNTPVKTPIYKRGPRGTVCLIPYEQFDPRSNNCFAKGDSSHGMKLKHNAVPITVEHNGKIGELYWVTDKNNKRYEIFHRLFGSHGPLGAIDHNKHQKAMSMIDAKSYFLSDAVRNKRKEISEIIGGNAGRIEALIGSGAEVNLKEEWKRSISETLFRCLIGNVSEERQEDIIRNAEIALNYLIRTKAISPIPKITIFSNANQEGERALKELDIMGLEICSERLRELENRNPETLIDWLTLSVVNTIREESQNKDPEEVVLDASKTFLEMMGAGVFTRTASRSNFDYLALTDNDFRQRLVRALDQFNSPDLNGIIQGALNNEKLLEPFYAAACAALAYNPTVLFASKEFKDCVSGITR